MSQKNTDPCQKIACELQVCLKKENFQESSCQEYVDRLVECCRLRKKESFKVCGGMNWKVISFNDFNRKKTPERMNWKE